MPKRTVTNSKRPTLRRLSACAGASLGALVFAVTVLTLVFGDAILNGYGKQKAERVFAQAHPGSVLQIGELDYSPAANRLIAQSVTVSATNATLKVDRISLMGVRWRRLEAASAWAADTGASPRAARREAPVHSIATRMASVATTK